MSRPTETSGDNEEEKTLHKSTASGNTRECLVTCQSDGRMLLSPWWTKISNWRRVLIFVKRKNVREQREVVSSTVFAH